MTAPTAAAAYMAAWNAIKQPELDKKNPRFGNRYASLLSMQNAIRKACGGLGIVYRQSTQVTPEGTFLVSEVMGESERIELSRYPLTVSANDQENGKNLTYAKRQQCGVDWGICGDEDDDGEAQAKAMKPAPKAKPKPAPKQAPDALKAAKSHANKAMKEFCERNNADYAIELAEFLDNMRGHEEDAGWFERQATYYEAN